MRIACDSISNNITLQVHIHLTTKHDIVRKVLFFDDDLPLKIHRCGTLALLSYPFMGLSPCRQIPPQTPGHSYNVVSSQWKG
jgi:hypothetical protein